MCTVSVIRNWKRQPVLCWLIPVQAEVTDSISGLFSSQTRTEGLNSACCSLACPHLRTDLFACQSLGYVTVPSNVCQQQQIRVLTVNCRQWSLRTRNSWVLRVTIWSGGLSSMSLFVLFKIHRNIQPGEYGKGRHALIGLHLLKRLSTIKVDLTCMSVDCGKE